MLLIDLKFKLKLSSYIEKYKERASKVNIIITTSIGYFIYLRLKGRTNKKTTRKTYTTYVDSSNIFQV